MSVNDANHSNVRISEALNEDKIHLPGAFINPHSHLLKKINNENNLFYAIEEYKILYSIMLHIQITNTLRLEKEEFTRIMEHMEELGKFIKSIQGMACTNEQALTKQQLEQLNALQAKIESHIQLIDKKINALVSQIEENELLIFNLEQKFEKKFEAYKNNLAKQFSEAKDHLPYQTILLSNGRSISISEIILEAISDKKLGEDLADAFSRKFKEKLQKENPSIEEQIKIDKKYEEIKNFVSCIEDKHELQDEKRELYNIQCELFEAKNKQASLIREKVILEEAKENLEEFRQITSKSIEGSKCNPAVVSQVINSGESILKDILKSCSSMMGEEMEAKVDESSQYRPFR